MNFFRVCLLLSALVFTGCKHVVVVMDAVFRKMEAGKRQSPTVEPAKPARKTGLITSRRKDGSLLSQINFKDGKMHGIAKSYYKDGTIHFIYPYTDGLLDGDLLWYYPIGKLYKSTPYVKGKIEGTAKTFNQSGELIGETPYKNNFAGLGLKEYTSKGNLKKMPELIIKMINNSATDNEYVVTVRVSDGSKLVKFYVGGLTDNKYMNDDLMGLYTEDGVGIKQYKVPPGFYLKEKLNFVAAVTTSQGNTCVLQKPYTLEIQRPLAQR